MKNKIKYILPFIISALLFASVNVFGQSTTKSFTSTAPFTNLDLLQLYNAVRLPTSLTFTSTSLGVFDNAKDTLNNRLNKGLMNKLGNPFLRELQKTNDTITQNQRYQNTKLYNIETSASNIDNETYINGRKLDTINQYMRVLKKQNDTILNSKIVDYKKEWVATVGTYSAATAPIIGTLTASSFSLNLGVGYYELVFANFIDFSAVFTGGFTTWVSDSLLPITDNVAIDFSSSSSKRHLVNKLDFTSQGLNSTGRLFFPVNNNYNTPAILGQRMLYTGVIYFAPTVVGTGTNTSAPKRMRFIFKRVS